MGKQKKQSPPDKNAKSTKKYSSTASAEKSIRCKEAIIAIQKKEVSIRKASKLYGLSFGYLQRRLSGAVDIESRNGPQPIFSQTEEEAMAHWLKAMVSRGMGLRPGELLDYVQNIVTTEKKQTPFTNNRPGYEWYYAFMKRNSHILEMRTDSTEIRTETPLETCRANLTKEKTDKWYCSFRDFLNSKGLLEKPACIWHADETEFSLGRTSGQVIGPIKAEQPTQVSHVSEGYSKQNLTVMFCGSANGTIMPPFFVYPEPKPKGYNPMTGGLDGSDIAYTKKGSMDGPTFDKFLHHFHTYAGKERPVVLLIDSVNCHISMSAFELANSRGIELYHLLPNATHLMQPLDIAVYEPLKQQWDQVVRTQTRNNPDIQISKVNFAEKLKEAYLLFYKPLTVINAFKSSGIYPVDSTIITKEHLKSAATFSSAEAVSLKMESSTSTECQATTSNTQQLDGRSLA